MANKMGQWVHDHKKEILIAGCTTVIVGCAVWVITTRETGLLKKTVRVQSEIIKKQGVQITDLKELCMAKDDYVRPLASRLLREGHSEGGKLMADLKAYYNAA